MATIKDVAREAGVSTATVSRVLNGNYPVSQDAREKVEATIKRLGYHPNAVARSLKQNKTFLIGVVVPDISNTFFMDLAKGVESKVSPYGYNLVFGSTEEDAEKEVGLLNAFAEKRLDGVIVASRQEDSSFLNSLPNRGISLVMVDTLIDNVQCDCVIEDDYEASYRMVEHLLSLGHKDIAIVNGLLTVSTSKLRLKGYKDALKKANVPINPNYMLRGDYSRKQSYNSMKELLASGEVPTAIFSTNNAMTEGVMLALKEEGLRIPDDLSLVSFGNISLPGLIDPELTYVKQNAYAMGVKAGERMMVHLAKQGDSNEQFTIKLDIHHGASVKTRSCDN